MKVLLVFANVSVREKTADPEKLKIILQEAAEIKALDMQIFTTTARSLSYFVSNVGNKIRDSHNHMNLEDYDFVYFRKAGAAMQQMMVCAHYLEDKGIPFFDRELLRSNSRNKLSQMYILQKKGLNIPKTLFCRNNRRLLRLVSKRYAEHFPFPVIAKASGGTRGDANYLVKNEEDLKVLLADEKRHFLIQEFIPNDGDYRFFIADGVVKGIIERRGSGDTHLNNTSKGGSASLVSKDKFSSVVRSESVFAAEIFGRTCAGVDILFDNRTGAHYILEVNRAPQIDGSSFESEKGSWMIEAIHGAITNFQPTSRLAISVNSLEIGRLEAVRILNQGGNQEPQKIIAKVDTGADSSSLHCTVIGIKDQTLSCMIGNQSFSFERFHEKNIRSSNGILHKRYLVEIPITIGSTMYIMKVNLNDRTNMNHYMLIGRRFLRANKLVVNVSKRYILSGSKPLLGANT